MQTVLFETAAMVSYPSRPAWDASAAELVHTMLDRWHLTAGEAYVGGAAASVLRVTTRDGSPAVLKVGFPHAEGVGEALALEAWGAEYSPAVLRQDPWTWSLLLERIEPGIPLSRSTLTAAEALDRASAVLSVLVQSPIPEGIPTLAAIVNDYLTDARARLPEQRSTLRARGVLELVETALEDAAVLVASDGGGWFLHGDFNPGNLLLDRSSGVDRWRVIDPKPMRGDREFDLWPIVEQVGSPFSRPDPTAVLAEQLRLVVDRVGCDYERAVRWAVVRAALDVTWYVEDDNHAAVESASARLRVVAALSAV